MGDGSAADDDGEAAMNNRKGAWSNGWTTNSGSAVANQDLWERLSRQVTKLESRAELAWIYVPGHQGVPARERVPAAADLNHGAWPPLRAAGCARAGSSP